MLVLSLITISSFAHSDPTCESNSPSWVCAGDCKTFAPSKSLLKDHDLIFTTYLTASDDSRESAFLKVKAACKAITEKNTAEPKTFSILTTRTPEKGYFWREASVTNSCYRNN